MARSGATSVDDYLNELAPERRAIIAAVRDVINRNLPKGYRETMNWGMISYELPLERYPDTYNGQPLMYAALAAQKSYHAIYLPAIYQDSGSQEWFREEFRKAGKKLDMGKSCVRFRKVEDLPLDVIGKVIARMTPEDFIETYKAGRKETAH